jgi:dTDP-4-amino-4,6-dideoxygalactose transaminase
MLDLPAQYGPIREEIRAAIDRVCDSQALILGPAVESFETHLAAYCRTKHAIGVSSGTDALLCALMALGIGPGDEVICPAFTFFATAGSIARLGARPVFVDINPQTFNLDPADIRRKLSDRTRAIMPVHLFGQMADMEAIHQLADQRQIPIIEDAAQAIGAKRHGRPACSVSLAGCLSFFPSKNLGGFGDGGAICTSDDAFAERCRSLRMHGSTRQYHHDFVGANFRLDALQAAVLDVKLRYLAGWHEARRRNAAIYDALFADSPVTIPVIDQANDSVYNQYVIRVSDRDRVRQVLTDRGVGSAIYYPVPLHLQECFRDLGGRTGDLPHTEQACHEVLALPIYPELAEEQIRYVADAVLEAVR